MLFLISQYWGRINNNKFEQSLAVFCTLIRRVWGGDIILDFLLDLLLVLILLSLNIFKDTLEGAIFNERLAI